MNRSKAKSSQQRRKWLLSGAVAGVSFERGNGFDTIVFSRPMRFNEVMDFYEKCGLRIMSFDALETLIERLNAPDAVAEPPLKPTVEPDFRLEPLDLTPVRVGSFQLSWIDDHWRQESRLDDDWGVSHRGLISVLRV